MVARGDENRLGQRLFGSVSAQLRAASRVMAAGQVKYFYSDDAVD